MKRILQAYPVAHGLHAPPDSYVYVQNKITNLFKNLHVFDCMVLEHYFCRWQCQEVGGAYNPFVLFPSKDFLLRKHRKTIYLKVIIFQSLLMQSMIIYAMLTVMRLLESVCFCLHTIA